MNNSILMWHGTSTKNYNSILDKGLVYSPNNKRNYKKGHEFEAVHPEAVYLTTSLEIAYRYAKVHAKRYKEKVLFVLAKINLKKAFVALDESYLLFFDEILKYNHNRFELVNSDICDKLYQEMITLFPDINRNKLRSILELDCAKDYVNYLKQYLNGKVPEKEVQPLRRLYLKPLLQEMGSLFTNADMRSTCLNMNKSLQLAINSPISVYGMNDKGSENNIVAVFVRTKEKDSQFLCFKTDLLVEDTINYEDMFVEQWRKEVCTRNRKSIKLNEEYYW